MAHHQGPKATKKKRYQKPLWSLWLGGEGGVRQQHEEILDDATGTWSVEGKNHKGHKGLQERGAFGSWW
jgi:hypothetical protein